MSSIPLTVGRSLEADLGELLARLGTLAREQEIGVAFVVDELQELDDEGLAALCAAMHRVLGDAAPSIDAGAVERMVTFAGGYPMLLQAIGKHAWNRATGDRITVDDVLAGEQDAFDDLSRELFLARWQRATPRERDYLMAVASAGGACGSAEAARAAGFPGATAASIQRGALIAKGLLWAPERGQVAFTMPLFERFVLARHEHEPAR